MSWKPDFYWIGPPKSASTWAHQCFREHPEVFVPERDYVRYFDMYYHRGLDWYKAFYEEVNGEKVIGDCSPTYFQTDGVAERIHEFNPDAKIIASLRDPVDRTFSHYWHLKKNGRINCEFNELFDIPDFFRIFVRTSFYFERLKPFYDRFPEHQIHIMFFDELLENEEKFIQDIYKFLGVNQNFVPSVIGEKVNRAGVPNNLIKNAAKKTFKSLINITPGLSVEQIKRSNPYQSVKELLLNQTEYEKGMSYDAREKLNDIFKKQNQKLEGLLSKEVPSWKE